LNKLLNHSLKYKLNLGISFFYLLLSGLFVADFTFSYYGLKQQAIEKTREQIKFFSPVLVKITVLNDMDDIAEISSRLRLLEHIKTIYLYDLNGKIIFRYLRETTDSKNNPPILSITPELNNGFLKLTEAVYYQDRQYARVFFHVSLKQMSKELNNLIIVFVLIIAILSFMLFLLYRFINNSITEPITRLAASLDNISTKQDYSQRIKIDREDEIGSLYYGCNNLLQQIEQSHHDLLNSSGEGICGLDKNGRIIFVNPSACEILAYKSEELINKPLQELIQHSYPDGTAYPRDKSFIFAAFTRGEVHKSNEDIFWQKDGSYIPVEYSSMPVKKNDKLIGAVISFRDISERNMLQQKLKQQQQLIDVLHDSTTSFMMQGNFDKIKKVMLNTLLKLTESDYGFTGEIFYDDHNQPYLKTHVITNIAWDIESHALYKEYEQKGFEFRNLNSLFGHVMTSKEPVISNDPALDPRAGGLPEGHPPLDRFLGVPIFYGTDLVGMFGIANRANGYNEKMLDFLRPFQTTYGVMIQFKRMMERDQSNREELLAAKLDAENANRAKSQFLSTMSHELRTPLNAILGFSQLLKIDKDQLLTDSQMESVDEITHAGKHLLELINEVLDLAKIEAGRIDLSIDTVWLGEVLSEALQLINPLVLKSGIEVSLKKNGNIIKPEGLFLQHMAIRADRTRLKQALLNLLSNAVKYNSDNGKIIISCQQTNNSQIRISITDTGSGLSPEQQSQLFGAFVRLAPDQEGIEGTGIGLLITKNIVELMGGNIGVSSESGKGSTFWIEFPDDTEQSTNKKTADEIISVEQLITKQQPIIENESGDTVLYIEDNPANLRLVSKLLSRKSNLHLWSAHEPMLGLELAMEHKPDLILLDINLPGMDGFEVLKQLRQSEQNARTPVIAISANTMPADIKKGLEAGFDDYISKPIDVKGFIQAINKFLHVND
jgi:PAS domain S-box-containing protein